MNTLENFRPGFNQQRLWELMAASCDRCQLDLQGMIVYTEAASGAYMVTPVLAALAGAARVYAITRNTRYGTVAAISEQTLQLARKAGLSDTIKIVTQKEASQIAQADIVTNSGHVRPIDATTVSWMRDTAVVPLMYEAWEFRPDDVDLQACRERGITVAGTNERHPAIDVFSFLGIMAVKLLLDAGVAVYASRLLILCDNPFAPFILQGLNAAGGQVDLAPKLPRLTGTEHYDAVLVALRPQREPVLGEAAAATIAAMLPGAVVAQYWGDIDREAFFRHGVPLWPVTEPSRGHMGILPSEIGPEPIVRLQAGGLKVGEVLARRSTTAPEDLEYLQWLDHASSF
jgi:hypothetical protein